jgi:hypothetical protein
MINNLKRNLLSNQVWIFVLAILFWTIKILNPHFTLYDNSDTIFGYNIFINLNNYILVFAGLLLSLTISFLINYYNLKVGIVYNSYQASGFIFIIFSGLLFSVQSLNSVVIANLFIILSFGRILTIYKKRNCISNCFDAGILLGLGSFFHLNLIFFIPIFIIAILILRVINIKELLVFIIGFITVYIFYAYYLFFFSDIDIFFNSIIKGLLNENHLKYSSFNIIIYISLLIIGISGILGRYLITSFKKVVTRNYFDILIIYTIFIYIYLLSPYSGNEVIVFLFAPLSFLCANILINAKNVVSSVLLYSLVIMIILLQGFQFMYYLSIN